MSARVVGVMALVCAAAWALIATAAEEQKPAKPVERPAYYMMPGHQMLGMEQVQKKLDLVPEQKEKLAAIAKKFQEDYLQAPKDLDWGKIRELPREEQAAKYREYQQRYTKLAAEAKQQVDAVLLPHQKEMLEKLELRQRIGQLLYYPGTLDKIGFSEQQKEQLKQLRDEQMKKYTQFQEEMMDKTMELLTPAQQKQLQELGAQGYQAWGQPGKSEGDKGKDGK